MRTIYKFDERYRYTGSEDIGAQGHRPKNSVLTAPPTIPAGQEAVWRGAQWVLVQKDLAEAQDISAKEAAIRAEGAARLLAIAGTYQGPERETWAIQAREAREWLADNTVATPMLSAIAAGRGIDMQTMVDMVMGNVTAFEAASGAILGQQQALLDQLWALAADPAATLDQLAAVRWP